MEYLFGATMKGVSYLVNEAGNKTAVILDLRHSIVGYGKTCTTAC